ncbi:MAG: hypothetical protein EXR71_19740 [Myxococcales bacterium]|nr:hypothetical protein [Myxococcales bacterium]
MIEVMHVVNGVAAAVYGGGLLLFAILLLFRWSTPHVRTEDLLRVYRSFGAGFGLSLGAFIPSELYLHALGQNPGVSLPASLAAHWDTTEHSMLSARLALIFIGWVSYVHLEIWTLDPARTLDKEGHVVDPAAYEATAGRVSRQLAFNATLFTAVLVLGTLAGR